MQVDGPVPQLPLFDQGAGLLAAEDGIGKALQAERVGLWKAAAFAWIARRQPGSEFTADDLVRELGLPDEGVNRNNVVGAVFSTASRAGTIRFAGRMRKSARVARHANVQRVWVKQ